MSRKPASNAKRYPLCENRRIADAEFLFAKNQYIQLVGALPQSPQNTKVVFWNAG